MEYEYNEKLKKKACNELEEYGNKSKLSYEDWKVIHLLEDTVKNINKNKMLEESEGYSEARGRGGRSSYAMGGSSYDDDMIYSERKGRERNARRDRMGRYSSDEGSYQGGSSYDDYSEEGSYRGGSSYERGGQGGRGYSKDEAKDHFMRGLGYMMEDANPNQREIFKDAMRKLERT